MFDNFGAKKIIEKFKNQLRIFKGHPELNVCYRSIKKDYNNIKNIKYTGDMYDYFKKYADGEKEFEDLYIKYKKEGYLSNWSVCAYLERNYKEELNNRINIDMLYPGIALSSYDICKMFGLPFLKKINESKQYKSIVLIDGSKNRSDTFLEYKNLWYGDVLHFIGEGELGNQDLEDNRILYYSDWDKHLFKYSDEKPNDDSDDDEYYIYLGIYKLSGMPYQEVQLDKRNEPRLVYIFPLVESEGITFKQEIIDSESGKGFYHSTYVYNKIKHLTADQAKIDLYDEKAPAGSNLDIIPKSVTTYVYEKYVKKNDVLIKRFDFRGGVYKIEKADNYYYFSRICGVGISHRTAVLTKADFVFVKDINNITYNEFISLLNYIIFTTSRFGI